MSLELGGTTKPPVVQCEAKVPVKGTNQKMFCPNIGTHIYGPECEAETGKLMYLCDAHAVGIQLWKDSHPNDPVECPTHGHIGPVKNYVILKKM